MLHAKTFNWAKYEDVTNIQMFGLDYNNATELADAILLRLQRLESEMRQDDEHDQATPRQFVIVDIQYGMSNVAYHSRSAVVTYGYTTEIVLDSDKRDASNERFIRTLIEGAN